MQASGQIPSGQGQASSSKGKGKHKLDSSDEDDNDGHVSKQPKITKFTPLDQQRPYSRRLVYPPREKIDYNGYTRLAKLYGLPQSPWDWDIQYQRGPPWKSGYTPITPQSKLQHPITYEVQRDRVRQEIYQMARLNYFTAEELKILEVIPALEDVEDSVLNTPIHPMMARDRWYENPPHNPAFPLAKGREGYWKASNDDVWRILQPILRLASQTIRNAWHYDWWDTLVFGQRTSCPAEDTLPGRPPPVRIRRRNIAKLEREEWESRFNLITKDIKWAITSGSTAPLSGRPFASGAWYGCTTNSNEETPLLWLAFERLEPLFWDLAPADRLHAQFRIANTCVHELAHAVRASLVPENYQLMRHPGPDRATINTTEPFFENEAISELGASAEKAVWGGLMQSIAWQNEGPLFQILGDRLSPGTVIYTYPNEKEYNYAHAKSDFNRTTGLDGPHVLKSELQACFNVVPELYPVPIYYYATIQKREFWEGPFMKYGPEVLSPWPWVTLGRRGPGIDMEFDLRSGDHNLRIPHAFRYGNNGGEPLYRDMTPPKVNFDQLIQPAGATPAQIFETQMENNRRDKAAAINNAFVNFHNLKADNQPAPGPSYNFFQGPPQGPPTTSADMLLPPGPCPRLGEIFRFWLNHFRALAVHTIHVFLDRKIPENTMWHYTQNLKDANGQKLIELSPEEFRCFCRQPECQESIFTWRDEGAGMLEFDQDLAGYPNHIPPTNTMEPVTDWEDTYGDDMVSMIKSFASLMTKTHFYRLRHVIFPDLEADRVRADFEAYLHRTGALQIDSKLARYNDMIDILTNNGWWITHGPPGMIRRTRTTIPRAGFKLNYFYGLPEDGPENLTDPAMRDCGYDSEQDAAGEPDDDPPGPPGGNAPVPIQPPPVHSAMLSAPIQKPAEKASTQPKSITQILNAANVTSAQQFRPRNLADPTELADLLLNKQIWKHDRLQDFDSSLVSEAQRVALRDKIAGILGRPGFNDQMAGEVERLLQSVSDGALKSSDDPDAMDLD